MGVLTNGYRDKIGVFRTYGGSFHNNSFPQGTLGNYNLTGMKRNITAGEGITDEKVGLPMGYVMKGWQMPQKAGMISARSGSLSVAASGNAVMGYPIEATGSLAITADNSLILPLDDSSPLRTGSASFSLIAADAIGQLISSGNGSATIAITTNTPLLTASIGGTGSAVITVTTNTPTLGAEASAVGSASITITVANAQAYPLNDASPLRNGAASLTISGTLTPYAIGQMAGSTIDSGVLTADAITAAVWNAILADFNDNGTAGKALASAGSGGVDLEALAAAILSAAQVTPIHSDIQRVNGIDVNGSGTTVDPWQPN